MVLSVGRQSDRPLFEELPKLGVVMLRSLVIVSLFLNAVALVSRVDAKEIRVSNDLELARALAEAGPGDSVLLAPGRYKGGVSRSGLKGTKEARILIAGTDPERRPTIVGGGSGLHLRSPAYAELRDLIFEGASGNGLNIDDGGNGETAARDLRLVNLAIRDIGPKGNSDGLKLSGVERFHIENCQVEKWGDSGSAIDMVGCHDGVVEGCHFRDARGRQANAVQAKGGSREITIRGCKFVQCGGRGVNAGGSTGADYFRPKNAPYEAKQITIEDCTFIGGDAAMAFVGVDGATARHNTIYCPGKWAIRILQENQDAKLARCGNVTLENNLFVFRASEVSTAINIGPHTAAETFTFSHNVWSCVDRPQDTLRLVKLPSGEKEGVYDAKIEFKSAEKEDLTLLHPVPNQAGAR